MSDDLNESMKIYLRNLEEEYVIYKKLFQKAKSERAAIDKMDMKNLAVILQEKQELLERALKVDEQIAGLREVWKEAKDLIQPELSKKIKTFLQEFSSFMKELVDFGAENEKLFLEKNEIKEKEVGAIRRAKHANSVYQRDIPRPSGKTDLLG